MNSNYASSRKHFDLLWIIRLGELQMIYTRIVQYLELGQRVNTYIALSTFWSKLHKQSAM